MASSAGASAVSIRIHGVEVRYGDHVALARIDLEVLAGEFVCLLGPSGCGKTTLLNAIAGFVDPTAGRIEVNGRAVEGPAPDRGMVFQEYALFPWWTVEKNIQYGPRLRGVRGAELRSISDRYCGLVGLEGAAKRYPVQLSGGMRQRVAIARALAVEPAVVVADEPTSMLDVSIRIGILNLMRELKESRRLAFLYVTHDLASARYVADDVLVMYAGQIVEHGPTEDVLQDPRHPYTQLLLSAVPDPDRAHTETFHLRKAQPSAAVDPGDGCRFRERCPLVIDVCSHVTPALVDLLPRRAARCHVTAPSTDLREDVHEQPVH
jgi:oligopeptide/dipeptide ABC transporter ATP-binding protein